MAKRWRKQKAAQQQPKKRRPKAVQGSGDASSAAGTLGAFRRTARGLFSGKKAGAPKTGLAKAVDALLWVAVLVAGYVLVSRQCMR